MVSMEMPEPIATEFRKAYEEQNLGLSVKLALENLTQRIPLLDLKICVTAILIQRETGGNLAEILEKVAYTIRERFRIMGDLKTLTTSSRMADICGVGRHGNESRIHERALERSARALPDRRRADDANHGYVDSQKDSENQDLATDYTDHTDATHNRHLHFRLHLPRNAGCLLVTVQTAECCD
jgi:hypothetical protein